MLIALHKVYSAKLLNLIDVFDAAVSFVQIMVPKQESRGGSVRCPLHREKLSIASLSWMSKSSF